VTYGSEVFRKSTLNILNITIDIKNASRYGSERRFCFVDSFFSGYVKSEFVFALKGRFSDLSVSWRLFNFFLACKELVNDSGKGAANERGNYEYPNVCKSVATYQKSGTEASCRVNGSACEGDA